MNGNDRAGEFGPIYLPALQRIRDLWLDLEPLVDETKYDDAVAPTELQISLSDGLGDAESARHDIQWSELGMYSFHYVDSDDVKPTMRMRSTCRFFPLAPEHHPWT